MEGQQVVHPFANSVSEDSGLELNLHRLSCEKLCAEDEQCTCTNMTENVEVQQASSFCPAVKKDNAIDGEVGIDEIFHLQSSHEQLAGHDPTSEDDKVHNSEDVSVSKGLIISDVRVHKCLNKSSTFPTSEVESFNFFYPEINGESPNTSAPAQISFADKLSIYKRSTSLPASSMLISAMKGGRAQKGTSPRKDMRVKWAEDVYDPPETSMSHTVKSYILQRPKPKKKDNHKQKHNKGKNSRANAGGGGKKFSNRRNAGILSAPFPAKLQSGGANGSAVRSEDRLEFVAVGGAHDVKCGSILLRESLAKVHPSFGEAT